MVSWHKRLIAAIAAIFLLLGTGTVAGTRASGEKAVLIPRAHALQAHQPLLSAEQVLVRTSASIFEAMDDSEVIDYCRTLKPNWAIRQG